jgi:hypothetical protein
MKTLELKLKKDVLIVEAPLDAYDVSIGTHCIGVRTNENVEKDTNGFYHIYKKGLFFGDVDMKLEFICKGSELTEEIVSKFFEYDDFLNCFESYIDTVPSIDKSALKLFIKIFESKGFYWFEKECNNQFCENGKVDVGYNTFLNCQVCEEAEEKTFRNPLIFVKK